MRPYYAVAATFTSNLAYSVIDKKIEGERGAKFLMIFMVFTIFDKLKVPPPSRFLVGRSQKKRCVLEKYLP